MIKNAHKFAITNCKIITMGPKNIIDNGTIIVKGSKIFAVGKDVDIPQNIEVIDVDGCIATPGLIDAHTHLGLLPLIDEAGLKGNESTNPATPEIRAIDGIFPLDPGFKNAIKGGVTSVLVIPGDISGPPENLNVIAGLGVALKTNGKVVDKMSIRQPACMKMALGDRPKKTFNPTYTENRSPFTRMGVASIIRMYLTKARYYQKQKKTSKESSKPFEVDLQMEALSDLLQKKYPARIHAYRADDIYTAIRLMEEFNFELILDHAIEAHMMADELVKRKIPVVFGPLMHGISMFELENLSPDIPAQLHERGVKMALTSDHPSRPIQYLTYHAAIAVREGLPWLEALKAITLNAAEIIGVDNRVGSIEVGKDADIVVFDEDPLEPLSKVKNVFINGKKMPL